MSKFNPVVLITQPREITEVINSMKKYIKYPKVWFKGYTEPEVTKEINRYVRNTNYSHYIICADDVIVNEQVFEEMDKYVNIFSPHHETSRDIVTGWCNLDIDHIDGSLKRDSNIAEKEITLENGIWPLTSDYEFSSIQNILSRKGLIQTYLSSFALSCVPRETLIGYPLTTYKTPGFLFERTPRAQPRGCCSDHEFSRRITEDGIKIWTTPKMFIKHLREERDPFLKKNWIVGKVEPTITEEL
jgi:hypothetical protein